MKQILLTSLLITLCYFTSAQEIRFYAAGGLAGNKYKSEATKVKLKTGGHIGASYAHFFTDKLGLAMGLEFGYYGNKVTLKDSYSKSQYLVSDYGTAFDFRIKAEGYEENNYFTAFAVPLMLQYRFGKNKRFYANGGSKLIIPQKLHLNAKADNINLAGYFPDKNLLITDMPNHGFGSLDNWEGKIDLEQKLSVTLSFETGIRFNLGKDSTSILYAGFYIDYGLTEMRKNTDVDDKPFVEYSSTDIGNSKFEGMFNPDLKKVSLLAFGIKLKYAIGFKKKKEEEPENVPYKFHVTNDSNMGIECEINMQNLSTGQEITSTDSTDANGDLTLFAREGNYYRVSVNVGDSTYFSEDIRVDKDVSKNEKTILLKESKKDEPKEESEEELKPKQDPEKEQKLEPKPQPEPTITQSEIDEINRTTIYAKPQIGSVDMAPKSEKSMLRIIELMKKYKSVRLKVTGHTCNTGTEEFNKKLGMKRANRVIDYSVEHGIDRGRLQAESKGETRPKMPNTSEANKIKNRRVELKVIE